MRVADKTRPGLPIRRHRGPALPRLAAAGLTTVGLALATSALAQAPGEPFALRPDGGVGEPLPLASDRRQDPRRSPRGSPGAVADSTEPETLPSTPADPAGSPTVAERRPILIDRTLIPFDVNNDGVAEGRPLPSESAERARPATTVSPLAGGRQAARVMLLDAQSTQERRSLSAVLREESEVVRELRVDIPVPENASSALVSRPMVPERALRLEGEIDASAFNVFLSAAEAARGGTLAIGFTNSVLVLPEASRLRVVLNGRQVAQTAIDSPNRTKVIALPLSADLLRPGDNEIRFEAQMRHRIDCSLDATYELWAEIDTRLTGFSFRSGRLPLMGLADLPAVGVTIDGGTRLQVLNPRPASLRRQAEIAQMVQAATLRGRFHRPVVDVVEDAAELVDEPGVLTLALGTYDELAPILPALPAAAAEGPLTDLVDPPSGGPILVVSGPNERTLTRALARLEAFNAPPPLATPYLSGPRLVTLEGQRVRQSVALRDVGVETINFSGRRFRTEFNVALPADFFARAFGDAELRLDAAYADDVEPGSRLLVSVNGMQTSTVTFQSRDGRVFQDFPVVLPLQEFRPGLNTVEIVAELETKADNACLPGGTVPVTDRFALFSSTELELPRFARIGQLPNLAAFAADGFPTQAAPEAVRLYVGGTSNETLGAAATLLAKLAAARGASTEVTVVGDVAGAGDDSVLVVAPLAEAPALALDATGASSAVPPGWLQAPPGEGIGERDGPERFDDLLRRLRQPAGPDDLQVQRTPPTPEPGRAFAASPQSLTAPEENGSALDRWYADLQDNQTWLGEAWQGLRDLAALGVAAQVEGDVSATPVDDGSTVLIAQAPAPDNARAAWTVVTAPTPTLLSASVADLAEPRLWNTLAGRISAYELGENEAETLPVGRVTYFATMPHTVANVRLIAANWLSLHNGYYVVALVILGALLGLATQRILTSMGRRST